MKRRQLLIGVAGITTAGVAGLGSGAFSNATAQREVTVGLQDDSIAVLGLDPVAPPDQRSRVVSNGENQIKFVFPGTDDEAPPPNAEAVIQYEEEIGATDIEEGLFQISNNGTEEIQLSDQPAEEPNDEEPKIGIFDVEAEAGDDGLKPLLRDDEVILEPSTAKAFGVQVDTRGVDPDKEYETQVYISGFDPEEGSPPIMD